MRGRAIVKRTFVALHIVHGLNRQLTIWEDGGGQLRIRFILGLNYRRDGLCVRESRGGGMICTMFLRSSS